LFPYCEGVAVSLPPSDPRGELLNFAEISTHASVLRDDQRMVLRYSDAILAYATALLRRGPSGSPEDAEDVHMAIVQSMLEGKLSRHEASGRFRFFVRRAVRNAV
jgi:hypothetical protein